MKSLFILTAAVLMYSGVYAQHLISRAIACDGSVYEIYSNGTWKAVSNSSTAPVATPEVCKPDKKGNDIGVYIGSGESKMFYAITGSHDAGFYLRGFYYTIKCIAESVYRCNGNSHGTTYEIYFGDKLIGKTGEIHNYSDRINRAKSIIADYFAFQLCGTTTAR